MSNLSIKNLQIGFKTKTDYFEALKSISFEIKKGEIVGLVGESGSGKSVTSLAIMRLLENNAQLKGQIFLDDVDLLQIGESQMEEIRGNKIGMIFQEPMTSLNPVITCGKQVSETLLRHEKISRKEAKQKTIALFKEVKLPEPELAYDKFPFQMSGGQKQRVMIAMALACNPSILIADEPTTALDVTVQKNILDLLLKLRKERGMSILFISHDLGVIAQIADKILVMYKGKLVEQGNIEAVFLNPQHPYTKGLLACRPLAKYQLFKLPILSDFVNVVAGNMEVSNNTIENMRLKYQLSTDEIILEREKIYNQYPLLQIKDLCTWFPVNKGWFNKDKTFTKAVDGVSFDVFPGETFGLVGESGCGKTTLSRTILKLIEPTSGQIIFNHSDISHYNASETRPLRKDIQIIFQDPYSSLNPSISIGNALIEPLQVHKLYNNDRERKDFIIDLMEKVGLNANQFNRYPHEFSGGQRQRIVIARALALQPKLIICDESVSALDVSVQAQVLNLLKELQQQFKLTYIFISHDMAVVKHMANRMMVMNAGKIEEIGFPEDIYNHPKKEYTKRLIVAIPQ
jgi:peptide/nickel transport system ATP-binding protein